MKLSQILQIEHILSGRAIPSDMLDEHKVYYSKSRDKWIAIVDMEPTHLIRAFVKLQAEHEGLWEEHCETNQVLLDKDLDDSVNKRLLELGLDSLVLPTDATTGDMLTKAGIAICEAVRTAKEHDRETHDEFCYDPAFLAAIERLNETADVGFVIPDEDDPKRHHHEEVVEAAVEEDDTKEEPPVADALPLEVLDEMTKVLSGTVSDLQAYLDSGEALHLEALLQMEEDGKNRSTALTAIKVAIDELG